MIIIDADNCRIGRVGTYVAKQLLNGEEVHVINAENAVISGNKKGLVEKYQQRRAFLHKGDPEKGPTWSNVPHLFVKRLFRGMLNRKKQSGRDAFKRLRVHARRPADLKGDAIRIKGSELGKMSRYMRIKELCVLLGHSR